MHVAELDMKAEDGDIEPEGVLPEMHMEPGMRIERKNMFKNKENGAENRMSNDEDEQEEVQEDEADESKVHEENSAKEEDEEEEDEIEVRTKAAGGISVSLLCIPLECLPFEIMRRTINMFINMARVADSYEYC